MSRSKPALSRREGVSAELAITFIVELGRLRFLLHKKTTVITKRQTAKLPNMSDPPARLGNLGKRASSSPWLGRLKFLVGFFSSSLVDHMTSSRSCELGCTRDQ